MTDTVEQVAPTFAGVVDKVVDKVSNGMGGCFITY